MGGSGCFHPGDDHDVPGLLLKLVPQEGGWLLVALCLLVPCHPGGLCRETGDSKLPPEGGKTVQQFLSPGPEGKSNTIQEEAGEISMNNFFYSFIPTFLL